MASSQPTELRPYEYAGASPLAELLEVARFLDSKGWTPATSSNFSCRVPEAPEKFWVSKSGKDKGRLMPDDFLQVNFAGEPVNTDSTIKPSAETLLHAIVYRHFPSARSVMHTHSPNGTVLSKLDEPRGYTVFRNFEILKAFEGIKTHETEMRVPIFPNSQDMPKLSEEIFAYLEKQNEPVYGFLLAGHGLYTWGETVSQAKRHAEAFEYLMTCVLQLRSYGYAEAT